MLLELHVTNFVIIEQQVISLGPGLNVISGETGAGKSIVLQALDLVLGGRPKSRYFRSGTDSWEIQALFDLREIPREIFKSLPEIAQQEELVVLRSMNRGGRGKVYVNGRLGTVSLLQEITSKLISVCSQGHQVHLVNPAYHLGVIDNYGGHDGPLAEYEVQYGHWKAASERLKQARERSESNHLRRAELEFVVDELSKVELRDGIRQELEAEIKRLAGAEQLIQIGSEVSALFTAEQGVLARLSQAGVSLQEMTRIDAGATSIVDLFRSARTELQEFDSDLSDYVSGIEIDEDELERLRSQLAELARLERKYQTDDAGLLRLFELATTELEALQQVDDIEALERDVAQKEERLASMANELTQVRKKTARKLTRAVEKDLALLNMQEAKLSVEMKGKAFAQDGADQAEIFIAPNKGEPSRPLGEVASGGELSRILLVLKKVLREQSGVNVLIFDEVDTGVSGGVARAMGLMLRELSRYSQVLCITHLAQVASLADRHFLVDKQVGERTISVIREIAEDEKVDEIARMLAGYKITAATRESARELLSSK